MKKNIAVIGLSAESLLIAIVKDLVKAGAKHEHFEYLLEDLTDYDLYYHLKGDDLNSKIYHLTESLIADNGTNLNKNEVQSKIETNTKSGRGEAIKLRRESIKIASGERFVGNEIKVVTRRGKIGNIKVSPSAISSKNH